MNLKIESKWISRNYLELISLIITTTIVIWILSLTKKGFDFTDESSYLIWISNPFIYPLAVTQFGYLYHPLYLFLSGNIYILRSFNILFSLIAVFFLVYSVLIRFSLNRYRKNFLSSVAIASSISISGFLVLLHAGMWLITPSYNMLVFQFMSLALASLILINNKKYIRIFAWVLLGVAEFIIFFSKPPSAILFITLTFFYFILTNKNNLKYFLLTQVFILTSIYLFCTYISGSITYFILGIKGALELTKNSEHTISNIIRIDYPILEGVRIKLSFLILTVTSYFLLKGKIFSNLRIKYLDLIISVLILFAIILIELNIVILPKISGVDTYQALIIIALPIAAAIVFFQKNNKINRECKCFILLLFIAPYIYAFGTNNNYWLLVNSTLSYLVIIGFILLIAAQVKLNVLIKYGLLVQIAVVALLSYGIHKPYRQDQSLYSDKTEAIVGSSKLYVSKEVANYIIDTKNLLSKNGFKNGDSILDLTGRSPGLIYAVGGINLAYPWILGGAKNSGLTATALIKKIPCSQLQASWILLERGGDTEIPLQDLGSFGETIGTSYEVVGMITAPANEFRKISHSQEILKPKISGSPSVQCENSGQGR